MCPFQIGISSSYYTGIIGGFPKMDRLSKALLLSCFRGTLGIAGKFCPIIWSQVAIEQLCRWQSWMGGIY